MVSLLSQPATAGKWVKRIRRQRSDAATLDFSLVIPTYNERGNLSKLFANLDRILAGRAFEVILVDDDSPDGTCAAARDAQKHYPWLKVIRRRNQRGLSSAVICGFRHARGKILGVMDADLQHDDTRLPALLQEMEHADFAIATRRAEGGSDGNWEWSRRWTSWTATTLAKIIARSRLSDPMSGFFTMRRDLFETIDDGTLRPRGYKILLYLYSRARDCVGEENLRLSELGYEFRNREHGSSKLSGKVIAEFILMLLDLRFHARHHGHRRDFAHARP